MTDVEIIGPYQIGRTIGQGIFAKVKLGEDEFRQKVAIKIFDKLLLSRSQHQLLQVEKELNSLRCCHHPNIVQFYEVLETDSKIYLVMEHLAAGELYDYILDQGKLGEPESARLFAQIVSAVQHCHSHGIVHRDLKPENILLHTHTHSDGSQSIVSKIVDFGLANYYDRSADITQRSLHTQCGSPHYASPEILTGARYSGPLSDVWSLGVLLFAMLCGSLPFNARSVPLLIKKIVEGKFKFPKFLSASSRHLIALILQIQPENRPTLDEIARHPWLKQYNTTPAAGTDPLSPPLTAEVPSSTSPPFHRPVSRPEVINPESSRPQPGDLQRMMDKHKQAQRKVVAGQPAYQLPPSDILHFHSHSELSDGVGVVSSPHGGLAPGTPTHGGSGSGGGGGDSVKGAKVGAGFFSELLNFPSPRRRKGGLKCQFCGKSLIPRTTETGDFQIAKTQQRSAPTSPATSTPSSPSPSSESLASRYELCTCMRNRSHSPGPADRSIDSEDSRTSSTATSASSPVSAAVDREDPATFNPQSFRDAYFHPDDPKRKTNKQRRKEQETAQLSAAEQKRRDEDEERFLRACEAGDVDTVTSLIEPPTDENGLSTGPPLVDVRAKHIDNWTGLHYAARGGHVEVIQALLSSLQPLDINCRTKSSWSALMIAADKGWADVCALLVRYGAAIHITNSDGKSAIFLARESGFHEIAQLLTHASSLRHKRHALLTEEKEEGKEKALNYELFRAAEYGDISKVKHLLQLGSDKPKDRTSRRSAGGSPNNGSPGGSKKEQEKEAASDTSQPATRYTVDIAATGIDNWTALHFAARKGRAAVVSLLLSHQPPCPVNAVTKNGWTALMMACDKGYVDCVRLLCEGGADVNVRSFDGYSAYSVAKEGEHHEICDILVQAAKKQQEDKEVRARGERDQQEHEKERLEDVHEHDGSAQQNGASGHTEGSQVAEQRSEQAEAAATAELSSSNQTAAS